MSKGIVSVVLFGVVVAGDLLLAWRRREPETRPRWRALALGAAVFFLAAAPWYVAGTIREGKQFLEVQLGEAGALRYFQSYVYPLIPYRGYLFLSPAYIPLLMLGVLPWTGVLPGAIREGWRSLRVGPPSLRFAALWAGLMFLALSLSAGDKVIRYLLPLFPPLAVLVGVPGLLGVIWLLRGKFPEEQRVIVPLTVPFLAVFFGALVLFALAIAWGRGRAAVALLAAGALLSYGALEWQAATKLEALWPWRTVSATIASQYVPGDRVFVVGLDPEGHFVNYYLQQWVAHNGDETRLPDAWGAGHVFAVLTPGAYARLRDRIAPRVLLQTPGLVLVTNR